MGENCACLRLLAGAPSRPGASDARSETRRFKRWIPLRINVPGRMQQRGLRMALKAQDALLQEFLGEEDPAIAQAHLEELFSEHVQPVVRDITRYKLHCNSGFGRSHEAQDQEDINSEVAMHLLARLRELRRSRAQSPIEDFRGYVAATTYNVYHKYMRMKYPSRWRLKNRVRYLLNHGGGLALWKDGEQELFCGLTNWTGAVAGKDKISEDQPARLDEFVGSFAPGKSPSRMNLDELIKSFLAWRGSPIRLDELVGIVAELQDIREPQRVQAQGEEREEGAGVRVCELLPDPTMDAAGLAEQRSYLGLLWEEICQLPRPQRVALLLNLRDAQAGDALILFTFTGIVSLRRIAQVIEMPVEEFAPLWNKLPLEDMAIATLLGITRQQVINLRKSARERLARRMAAP